MLRYDVAAFLEALVSGEAQIPNDMGPAEARVMYREMQVACEQPIGNLHRVTNLSMIGRDGHAIAMRLYLAAPVFSPVPLILYFHGGGYVLGDLDTHDGICGELARLSGFPVLAVDYRRAPECKFPAAAHDAFDAMNWISSASVDLGIEVDGIILSGDSAGGALAAACAQHAVTMSTPRVRALMTFYGWFDMSMTSCTLAELDNDYLLTRTMLEDYRNAYLNNSREETDPQASPGASDNLEGHPPSLIFACEFDPLRDGSRHFAAKLASHGVSVRYREARGHIHGCMTLRLAIPSGQVDLEGCIADLNSLMVEQDFAEV